MIVEQNKNNNNANPFGNSKYNKLFTELYTPLCRYCIKFVGNMETAEDIVQDQFVYLWENWKRLSEIESIKAYLYRSVKNKSITYLQRHSTKTESLASVSMQTDEYTEKLPSPEEILENKELGAIIQNAIQDLPERCRTIFSLKKFGNLTNKEVAEKLNISIKTVETQMTIALKKLTTHISSKWEYITILCLYVSEIFQDFSSFF